jgi:hypothetical protein
LVWNHDLARPTKFHVLDAGDGGYRIHSHACVLEGMTGMIMQILPNRGRPCQLPVTVAWICECTEGDGYHIGLRCL